MHTKYEEAIQQLIDKGYGVVDNWLMTDHVKDLSGALLDRYKEADFKKAEIGKHTEQQIADVVRNDQIFWLDQNNARTTEIELFEHIESFVHYMNKTCFAGIKDYEFHYAVYDPGSYYARHKDQFLTDDSRKFSMVMYLNENWKAGDGGELIIFNEQEVKIEPIAGRLVFFDSALEHEVLRSNFQRKSVTGWLKG